MTSQLPYLITFDGEARSGKGTIVHRVKAMLEARGLRVHQIDRGQLFRGIAARAHQLGVDCNNPQAIDDFLDRQDVMNDVLDFLRTVVTLSDEEKNALLYTARIGEDSAKIGARPRSQELAIELLRARVQRDAREGIDVVLVDGRALEHLARDMHADGIAQFLMGFYFICDPLVGARRTLGVYDTPYEQLSIEQKTEVDALVAQIIERNRADRERPVEPLIRPDVSVIALPAPLPPHQQMYLLDTSADMTKDEMSESVINLFQKNLINIF